MPLTAEQIKKNPDRRPFTVEIPEWMDDQGNCTYRYRLLSLDERQELTIRLMLAARQFPDVNTSTDPEYLRKYAEYNKETDCWLISLCLLDDEGNRIFNDKNKDILRSCNFDLMNRLSEVILLNSKFVTSDHIDDLKKTLKKTKIDDSSST